MISARQISVAFSPSPALPVLDGLDLQVDQGEFVSVLGSSGCGKSTLLKVIAGLVVPSQGELTVGQARGRSEIGFVFQDPTLLPWRNVIDNIRLPLELRGQPVRSQLDAAGQMLEMVGLQPEDGLKFPRMLSGGMRMRVSLARALVTRPDILLLDEPFAALDDMLRQQLCEELLEIWQELRQTIVFVTHNVSEAVFLSQQVYLMQAEPGRLVDQVEVPFPFPRKASLRGEAGFARLVEDASGRLRETVA
ncbi:MAG: nitrate/sulfonate/bicarbonate ABC transporter ATP-binding protein [Planctomycetaceae bacterium]|jgi:NitT/TauT family transport system ATP-binding protein|nr:nitrate/sulfonate/bicarbonate ABC transporter ATP-binding protein [Planctomycetaceae bacterium]|tara:strand:- start:109 stop:855 length:747 start_codon:yes stop_codon:yes gene_type:complete